MRSGLFTPRVGVGPGICLIFCGCVGFGGPNPFPQAAQRPERPRPEPLTDAVADLRLPDDPAPAPPPAGNASPQTTPTSEIPLVPVPPLPLGGDRSRPAPPSAPDVDPMRLMPPADPVPAPVQPIPPSIPREPIVPVKASGPVQPAVLQLEGAGEVLPTPRQVYQQALAGYAKFDSYIARLTRREPAKGKKDDETLIFYARKDPWSVRFKWLAGEGQGREVLYVKDRFENKLHIILSLSDGPLMAGRKLSLSLDNPLVKMANPHPITQAGIGPIIERIGRVLSACERGDASQGKLTVLGVQQRPDYDVPLLLVEETLPPRADEDVPHGGRRLLGFHPDLHLPVLAILYDDHNQERDYYRFDRLQLGVHLNDADFDPEQMAKRPEKKDAPMPKE